MQAHSSSQKETLERPSKLNSKSRKEKRESSHVEVLTKGAIIKEHSL